MGNSEGEKNVASTSDGPKCRTDRYEEREERGGSNNEPGNDDSSSTNSMPSSSGSSTGDGSDRDDEPPESSGEVVVPGTDQKTIGVTPWSGTPEQCQKRIGEGWKDKVFPRHLVVITNSKRPRGPNSPHG